MRKNLVQVSLRIMGLIKHHPKMLRRHFSFFISFFVVSKVMRHCRLVDSERLQWQHERAEKDARITQLEAEIRAMEKTRIEAAKHTQALERSIKEQRTGIIQQQQQATQPPQGQGQQRSGGQ